MESRRIVTAMCRTNGKVQWVLSRYLFTVRYHLHNAAEYSQKILMYQQKMLLVKIVERPYLQKAHQLAIVSKLKAAFTRP